MTEKTRTVTLVNDAAAAVSPLDVLVLQAEQRAATPYDRWPASLTAVCVCPAQAENPGLCQVVAAGAAGPETHWLPRLENAAVRAGQTVLVVKPADGSSPVVVGGLAGANGAGWSSAAGHRVEAAQDAAGGATVRVLLPDGRTALEIDLREAAPTVRLLDDDVHLDLAGRLRITARSIDLTARQGSATVTAHDDFRVEAERIRLN